MYNFSMIFKFLLIINLFISSLFSISLFEKTSNKNLYISPASIFIDESKNLLLKDIKSVSFKEYKKNKFQFGYDKSNIWIRFKIKNLSILEKKYYIHFSSPFIETIEAYYKNNSQIVHKTKGKKHLDKYNREGIIHPYFSINLKKNETKDLYFKINSQTTGINFDLSVKDEKTFYEDELKYQVFQAFFFGAMTFLLIYNLLIFIQTKEKIYFYYLSLLSFILLHHLSFSAMSIYFVKEEYFYTYTTFTIYYVFFANIFVLLFIKNILELYNYKRINRIINTLIIINLILLICLYNTEIVNTIAPITIILTSLFIFSLIIFSLIKKHPLSKHIFLGWIIKLIGIVSLAFHEFGIISPVDYIKHFFEITLLIEFLVFSNTLALKLAESKRLKEQLKIEEILLMNYSIELKIICN